MHSYKYIKCTHNENFTNTSFQIISRSLNCTECISMKSIDLSDSSLNWLLNSFFLGRSIYQCNASLADYFQEKTRWLVFFLSHSRAELSIDHRTLFIRCSHLFFSSFLVCQFHRHALAKHVTYNQYTNRKKTSFQQPHM